MRAERYRLFSQPIRTWSRDRIATRSRPTLGLTDLPYGTGEATFPTDRLDPVEETTLAAREAVMYQPSSTRGLERHRSPAVARKTRPLEPADLDGRDLGKRDTEFGQQKPGDDQRPAAKPEGPHRWQERDARERQEKRQLEGIAETH